MESGDRLLVRLRTAGLVAGVAFLAAVPYAYYLTVVAFPERVENRFLGMSPRDVLEADLALLGLIVVIASLVGTFFSRRYRLGGLSDRWQVRLALRRFVWWAPLLGLLSYFVFGRVLAERIPGYFPTSVAWAAAMTVKGAVFDEVVARYGMMTVVSGVAPKRWIANVVQATFFTAMVFKGLGFFGMQASWDVFFVLSLVFTFVMHLLQGAIYARHGLMAAVLFHLGVDLRFVLHAVLTPGF